MLSRPMMITMPVEDADELGRLLQFIISLCDLALGANKDGNAPWVREHIEQAQQKAHDAIDLLRDRDEG
jgi:hypothetical protein